MKKSAVAFLSGLIFALGLGISGMTRPAKVLAFLDVTGAWDASLAFVMLGAIGVTAVACRLVLRRAGPVLGGVFQLPRRRDVDRRLLLGAAIFGVGWGLAGYCPGPGLVSLANDHAGSALAFVAAMLAGQAVLHLSETAAGVKPSATTEGSR
jgi:uncharacterized membrane protein YedE/YeeE